MTAIPAQMSGSGEAVSVGRVRVEHAIAPFAATTATALCPIVGTTAARGVEGVVGLW
jgi:hypothetical protein